MAFAKKALKSFGHWLFNKGGSKRREKILTEFNDETEWNQEKKELIKRNKALEGQLSKIQADQRKKVHEDKNLIDELELVKGLKEKSDEIEHKKHEGLYSLNSLFLKLSNNKKFKVEIVDKDDSYRFDYFKDFVVLPNGNIGIRGKSGEVWAEGKTLSDIIWKPETIKNQIKRKRIQMCYDKNFKYIPDLEKMLMPELKYDEDDNEFYESEQVRRPFKEMLIELTKENHELIEDKSYLEKTNELMHKKIKRIEQSLSILTQRSEIADSETSKALQTSIDSLKAIGQITRDNAILQDQKLTGDELLANKEVIINSLSETLEDDESKTANQKAEDSWQRMFTFAKKNAPQTIVNNEIPEISVDKVKPGEEISS